MTEGLQYKTKWPEADYLEQSKTYSRQEETLLCRYWMICVWHYRRLLNTATFSFCSSYSFSLF